ncbi:mechanosensitive ion channel protein [Oscillatoriales cyanobacterium LEGE 11467]|uniref:Mechanosensitive ion channel protein n=1 Tax=Zarconia navalis LEGE 11467 TaxID=1828826 RepID=A0A928VX19_9CYAN|nr:DEP domain-containing protein [Zarconia navalis]MBE9041802.1 mechanosensitive ion channel protein [Zarconia navalis LEGE 11467]
MLILNSEQVRYCQVTRQVKGQTERLLGIVYQAQLFSKCKSYRKDRKQEAIEWTRKKILETQEQILFSIVEEPQAFTIWRQDSRLKYAGDASIQSDRLVDRVNFKNLVNQMRQPGGVAIEDRRYNLKTYPSCFVGREAVSWMMQTLQISHEDAIDLGQKLIDDKWMHHVTDEHPFRDEYLFYRFELDK